MFKRFIVLAVVAVLVLASASVVAASDPWVSPEIRVHSDKVAVTSIGWTEPVDIMVGDTYEFSLTFTTAANTTAYGLAVIQVLGTEDPGDVTLALQLTTVHWVPLNFDNTLTAVIDEVVLGLDDQKTVALRATFYAPGTYQFAVWFVEAEE